MTRVPTLASVRGSITSVHASKDCHRRADCISGNGRVGDQRRASSLRNDQQYWLPHAFVGTGPGPSSRARSASLAHSAAAVASSLICSTDTTPPDKEANTSPADNAPSAADESVTVLPDRSGTRPPAVPS